MPDSQVLTFATHSMHPKPLRQRGKLSSFVTLSKPRILVMVVLMTAAGYFLGAKTVDPLLVFTMTLLGTALSSAGAATLNNYLERDCDLEMERTKERPIPAGIITPNEALIFGLVTALAGVALLAWQVNILTAFLSLLTTFLYVLVYTPLKRISWWNTVVGAIPGALPPMGGWAAATGELGVGAWIVFAILFVWQHPHFYAIAWMYKDDYARGGFKMLPVEYPDGKRTFRQIIGFSIALIPISLLPVYYDMAGSIYAIGMTILGFGMLVPAIRLWRSHTVQDARKLLQASIVYLPLFFALILCDSNI
ncbi:MAG: heme o synthase [Pseudomonadota bacterium]